MRPDERIDVGVIGVGSMGQHHARVYDDLPAANLVGVHDVDENRAVGVADRYGASAVGLDELLDRVDAASVVVPTEYHYDVTTACLDEDVAALVEKPVVGDLEQGRELLSKAKRADVPVQAGHVERFNPAVQTLEELLADQSIVGIDSRRLGPPPERRIDDSAVFDLMIHDIDIVLSLLDEEPASVKSVGRRDNGHVSALLEFPSAPLVSLTASHLTQRKVRTLEVTAEECLIELDYIDQSIEIHRHSVPEYVTDGDGVRFRHESVVERLQVPSDEPLRAELESFLEVVASRDEPRVPLEDGLNAIEVAQQIELQGLQGPARQELTHD